MNTMPFLLHALSPLHAGTGQAAGVIDLPIARLRSTGIPIVSGSSIKGVLRDARRTDDTNLPPLERDRLLAVFGPSSAEPDKHAGALTVGDARLLALPVRSFKGTFAWVSSPLLLDLAKRDISSSSKALGGLPIPAIDDRQRAFVSSVGEGGSLNVHGSGNGARVFLEDLDFSTESNAAVQQWAAFLAPFVAPAERPLFFARRFVVVHDEVMTFLWETATQIDTRVRIDSNTRTVAKGALWTEESLPSETLLIGMLAAERGRRDKVSLGPEAVLAEGLSKETILQFGGKSTVGRGRCRILPLVQEAKQ